MNGSLVVMFGKFQWTIDPKGRGRFNGGPIIVKLVEHLSHVCIPASVDMA
jgi:hypothetical protein